MEHTLKILGKASSINVRKVLWTCEELGLSYEREDWGSGFASTHSPEFLRYNPNAQVPVIIDEAGALWESNTICRYLSAKHQHHHTELLPSEPAARARVEQWMDWQATDLNSSWSYAFMALVRKDPEFQDAHRIDVGVRGWNQKMAHPRTSARDHQGVCRRGKIHRGRHCHRPLGQPLADDAHGASRLFSRRRVFQTPGATPGLSQTLL